MINTNMEDKEAKNNTETNEGRLTTEQQDELASLAELSEELSILRGEAAQYLGDSDS